jgi:signal transduction histidine kinase/ActR/RegA family two-component response regulator
MITDDFYSMVCSASPNGLVIFDGNCSIIDCNETLLKLFGVTKEYFTENFFTLSPENQPDGQKSSEKMTDSMNKALIGQTVRIEWLGQNNEGVLIPCDMTLIRVPYEDGWLGMVYVYDLSEIKKMQVSLVDAKEQAEYNNRAKSEFLSCMSHELLTPMNAIMGMTQIAKMRNVSGNLKDCLNEIETASRQLLTHINNVLDVSSMEYGSFRLTESEFDFNAMCRDLLHTAGYNAVEKKQILTVDVDQSIPASLIGDERRLRQVITNLLANAVKFTHENGTISFRVRALEDDDNEVKLEVSVADSGVGISKDHLSKLFLIFEPGDSSFTKKHGGIGLGLAISKRITEMMGGEMTVSSERGKGSVFTFTCRLRKDSRKYKKGDHSSPVDSIKIAPMWSDEMERMNADFTDKRILIADDMESNRIAIKSLLKNRGAEVIEADNGQSAIDLFMAEPEGIDLILMDIKMPGMDGIEAARIIRTSGKPNAANVPIIALTAHTSKTHVKAAMNAGMNFHLEKTGDPQMLLNMLRGFLS